MAASRRPGWRKHHSATSNSGRPLTDLTDRDLILLARCLAVEEGRSIGLAWPDAYQFAADLLTTSKAGAVGRWAMKLAHQQAKARWGEPDRIDWERLPPAFDREFWPIPEREEAAIRTALERIQGPGPERAKRAASKRERAARAIIARGAAPRN